MLDHHNVVTGVVQLINKKRDPRAVLQASLVEEEVIPFTSVDEELARSLASQAAVAYENAQLIQQIRELFDKFIYRAVTAIELRDPTTAGHSERVKDLSVCLIERVDAISTGPLANVRFTRDQVEELRYAALLHDFGKVAVQEKYLRKGKKLYASRMVAIEQRFAFILKSIEVDYLRKRLAAGASGRQAADEIEALEKELRDRQAEVRRVLDMVRRANEPKVVEDETFRALMNLPARPFVSFEAQDALSVEAWAEAPFLSTPEIEALSISKGSLSAHERTMIQSHVQHTYDFLKTLPWTNDLQRIPEIAWKHHEKLDGSGYPQKLRAADIPVQSRIMTIADIYDALVAWDRPYKPPVTEERARDILCDEARKGQLDKDLLQVFLETKVYDLPEFRQKLRRKA
jgi:HD-GYP domain-containing protein (c-di-GMP phosphodiesterase class II)